MLNVQYDLHCVHTLINPVHTFSYLIQYTTDVSIPALVLSVDESDSKFTLGHKELISEI